MTEAQVANLPLVVIPPNVNLVPSFQKDVFSEIDIPIGIRFLNLLLINIDTV